jgi:hypothetical protein
VLSQVRGQFAEPAALRSGEDRGQIILRVCHFFKGNALTFRPPRERLAAVPGTGHVDSRREIKEGDAFRWSEFAPHSRHLLREKRYCVLTACFCQRVMSGGNGLVGRLALPPPK